MDALRVTAAPVGPALTHSQKRFNTLVRQIEQTRNTIVAWQDGTESYRQLHAKVLEPLRAELLAGQRQWVLALDGAIDQRQWSKVERGTLRELLCEAAGELLDVRGDDTELKALFDKHAEVDFDTGQRERTLALKGLAEAMTGLDLGDEHDLGSEEELLERLRHGVQEHVAAQEAEQSAQAAGRRKSAAEQRRDAEALQATQSVRDIYRQLASALHPDRETDAQRRETKTTLMQRVNQAYEANDLLALLELQLQIEQIDASHLATASEQRLKHYNRVLSDQLVDLKNEVERVEMAFRMEFGLDPVRTLNPRKLAIVLEQTTRQWRNELASQQLDLRMLDNVALTKRWLKRQRQQRLASEGDFLPF